VLNDILFASGPFWLWLRRAAASVIFVVSSLLAAKPRCDIRGQQGQLVAQGLASHQKLIAPMAL
jgi:hypothetical protein